MSPEEREFFYHTLAALDEGAQPLWAVEQSALQEPFCYHALREARELAPYYVDDMGNLISHPALTCKVLYPGQYSADVFRECQARFLSQWVQDAPLRQQFHRFNVPVAHPWAREVICRTLDIPCNTPLEPVHVRRAAIIACLTPLRQSVGSCFATAPAIEIQSSYVSLLVDDLYALLSRGVLRRVIEGTEFVVPICLGTGAGDLNVVIDPDRPYFASPGILRALREAGKLPQHLSFIDQVKASESICTSHFEQGMTVRQLLRTIAGKAGEGAFNTTVENSLLKVWEFTLASYCDIKMEGVKWDLGWLMGFSPQEQGGIGALLLSTLQDRLDRLHLEQEQRERDRKEAVHRLHAVESLMRASDTMPDLRRLKAEHTAALYHLRTCEEILRNIEGQSIVVAELLKTVLDHYMAALASAFQEVYDPDFTQTIPTFYEDRPAGFRLVYKHRRLDAFSWSIIHDATQFIGVLEDFFRAHEEPLKEAVATQYAQELITEVTTLIICFIREEKFLDYVMRRAQSRGRLPWAHISGGRVDQIVSIYFRKPIIPQVEERKIQDELDLFVFMIETVKGFPPSVTDQFLTRRDKTALLTTPTHACLLMPGEPLFEQAWNDRGLTYTWIRDRWLTPYRRWYEQMHLSREEQIELYRRAKTEGPTASTMTLAEWASHITAPSDQFASLLFRTLPLIPVERLPSSAARSRLPAYLSSEEWFQLLVKRGSCKGARLHELRSSMRQHEAIPSPFLFADTNWAGGYFSFVVNPVTRSLEVWKTDRIGVRGAPLPLVKTWLGQQTWAVYRPF